MTDNIFSCLFQHLVVSAQSTQHLFMHRHQVLFQQAFWDSLSLHSWVIVLNWGPDHTERSTNSSPFTGLLNPQPNPRWAQSQTRCWLKCRSLFYSSLFLIVGVLSKGGANFPCSSTVTAHQRHIWSKDSRYKTIWKFLLLINASLIKTIASHLSCCESVSVSISRLPVFYVHTSPLSHALVPFTWQYYLCWSHTCLRLCSACYICTFAWMKCLPVAGLAFPFWHTDIYKNLLASERTLELSVEP